MRTVLLATLIVLAGCNGLAPGNDAGSTPSITPAPVPVTPGFPPGVTEDGVVDADVLASAHTRATDNQSYTVVSNRTERYANGSVRSRLAVTVALAADRSHSVAVSTAGQDAPVLLGRPPARAQFWSNGSTYVRAYTRNGETTYNEFQPPTEFVGTWRYWVTTVAFGGSGNFARETFEDVFESVEMRVTGQSTVDGEPVYRLVGRRDSAAPFVPREFEAVRNLTVRAVVSERGIVRTMNIRYDGVVDGERIRVHWVVSYDRVGSTTVERPEWFARAFAQESDSIAS